MRNKIQSLAFIVPCLNEEQSIPLFMDRVLEIRERDPKTVYKVMFVDDGSTDGSPEIMRALAKEYIDVSYVLLTRNFGAHVALLAGLDSILSDAVVFIPCDQKIDPDLIIEMLQYAREEADVIIGERKTRELNFFNKIFSKIFYSSFNFLGDIRLPRGGTDFVLMTRGPMDFLQKNLEYDVNVFMLLLWPGFKSKVVEYDSPPRQVGQSKWTMRKRIRLALDSFFGFSLAPLRMITFVGLFLSTTSFLFMLYTVMLYFTIGTPVPGIPTIVTTIAFGFGITFLGLGIIAEYLLRDLNFSRRRPVFVVEEKKISNGLEN